MSLQEDNHHQHINFVPSIHHDNDDDDDEEEDASDDENMIELQEQHNISTTATTILATVNNQQKHDDGNNPNWFCVLCGREHDREDFSGDYFIESPMSIFTSPPQHDVVVNNLESESHQHDGNNVGHTGINSPPMMMEEKSVSWGVIHQLFGGNQQTNIENMIQHYVELYWEMPLMMEQRRKLRICDRLYEFIDGYSEFVMFMNNVEHQQVAGGELNENLEDGQVDQQDGELNDEKQNENPQESQEQLMQEHVVVDLASPGIISGEEEAPTLDNTQSELDSDADEVKEKKFMKLLNGFSDKLMGDISKEYIQKPSLKDFVKDVLKMILSFALIMSVIALGAMAVMFIEQDYEYISKVSAL